MKAQLFKALALLGLLTLLPTAGVVAAPAPATGDSYTFPQTGMTVSGRFWQVWQSGRAFADSLYINGLPLTDKHDEISPTDGKIYKTQWFERARFEEHPENQPPFDVLLGLLGVQAARGRQEAAFAPVANPGAGAPWFPLTGHTLGDGSAGGRVIAAYWTRLGGLSQFGYPLSQPFTEVSRDDGRPYLVQYFERQRFEYHPENAGSRYEVLLGRLGAEQMSRPPANPTATHAPVPPATSTPAHPAASPTAGASATPTRSPAPAPTQAATATPTRPAVPAPTHTATPAPAQLPQAWLARLNAYRAASGAPPVVEDAAQSAADVLHVGYMLLNPSEHEHNETAGHPGYTDAGRQAAQQSNLFWGSPGYTPADAVDTWMDDALHRFALLNPPLTRTGFAMTCNAQGCAAALNILAATDGPGQPAGVVYPGVSQHGVQTGLITWQFGPFDAPVALTGAALRDGQGRPVAITTEPANGYFNILSVKPVNPLAAGTTYTVDITATQGGTPLHKTWSFQTR